MVGLKVDFLYLTTVSEKRRTFAVNMPREEIVKELGALNIDMISAEPINASAIRIKWEVSYR